METPEGAEWYHRPAVITQLSAGPYTIRGVSVGGVYTSLHVPELDVLFDVGIPMRSAAGVGTLLLSHAHSDHIGALVAMLGIRALHGIKKPLRIVMPAEIVATVHEVLAAAVTLQGWPLDIEAIGVIAGDRVPLRRDLEIRAFRTYHPVPSLGYQVLRRAQKLRTEFVGLPGPEIAALRRRGEIVTDDVDHPELAYATDTLVQVLDREPTMLESRVLLLECTFLDERKTIAAARAGCHIHLDELLERAALITNPHLVLMHFSQLYRPDEVTEILDRRLPPELRSRVLAFAPATGDWPG
jgi:ribonuclease Z